MATRQDHWRFYSRRQIDRELSYYISVGTPALVHNTKAKGSSLAPKTMWGIAVGMYRESVLFWMPHTNAIRQSKSFTAYKLRQGLNYAQFLNLPSIPTTQLSTAIPDDFKETVVIQLPEMQEKQRKLPPPVTKIKHVSGGDEPSTEQHNNLREQRTDLPHITQTTQQSDQLGGSVQVKDSTGALQLIDSETGYLESAHLDPETELDNAKLELEQHPELHTHTHTQQAEPTYNGGEAVPYVMIEHDNEVQKLWDAHDSRQHKDTAIVTRATDTFSGICKQHNLPFEHHMLYRQWLINTQKSDTGGKITPEHLPIERGQRLPPHLQLPRPHGRQWQQLKAQKLSRAYNIDLANKHAIEAASHNIQQTLKQQKHAFRATGRITLNTPEASAMAARKKKRMSHTDEPNNTREALEHPVRGKQWSESMDEEINGLTRMGVLDHGYTREDLHKLGITAPPVPLGLYHTHKTGKDGQVNRLKTRAAVQGHKGNMKKGVHFTETFAPTPSEDAVRVLCCLIVLLNLTRLCGDIEKAYCWADVPPGELIALSYPEGYKRVDEYGNELFMVMRKNLYGHPAAARAWTKERDSQLLKHFNKNGWTCKQAIMDPCLFKFTDARGKRAWVIVHTDDCDGAGEDETILRAIFDKMNQIWSIKEVDAEYMLGISRKLTYKHNKISSVECTMTPFIEAMAQAFKTHLPAGTKHTPVPDNLIITKYEETGEVEIREVLALGFQRAVGMLLWAARHCYPECKYGVSRLCSVMAKPTYKAFKAAMHMIAYLDQHKLRGIRFSLDGNHLPIALSDASNKPDPADGLAQAGFAVMWLGGPVAFQSKKLKHVGLSSEHNEYMGITWAVKRVVWLRQLLEELDVCVEVQENPTLVLGDNTQANRLAREHFISTGNQYIYLHYHFNKEAVELGHVEVRWLQSKLNLADLFTKPVPRQTMEALVGGLTGYDGPQHLEHILREMR